MIKLLTLLLCFCISFTVYADTNIKVTVDNSDIAFTDAEPFIDDNDRTQVPVRALAEALGCDVEWKQEAQEVILTKGYSESDGVKATSDDNYVCEKELHITINSSEYDGTYNVASKGTTNLAGTEWQGIQEMDTAPTIINDRTYLPARYVAEFFGYNVSWNDATQTVIINK